MEDIKQKEALLRERLLAFFGENLDMVIPKQEMKMRISMFCVSNMDTIKIGVLESFTVGKEGFDKGCLLWNIKFPKVLIGKIQRSFPEFPPSAVRAIDEESVWIQLRFGHKLRDKFLEFFPEAKTILGV